MSWRYLVVFVGAIALPLKTPAKTVCDLTLGFEKAEAMRLLSQEAYGVAVWWSGVVDRFLESHPVPDRLVDSFKEIEVDSVSEIFSIPVDLLKTSLAYMGAHLATLELHPRAQAGKNESDKYSGDYRKDVEFLKEKVDFISSSAVMSRDTLHILVDAFNFLMSLSKENYPLLAASERDDAPGIDREFADVKTDLRRWRFEGQVPHAFDRKSYLNFISLEWPVIGKISSTCLLDLRVFNIFPYGITSKALGYIQIPSPPPVPPLYFGRHDRGHRILAVSNEANWIRDNYDKSVMAYIEELRMGRLLYLSFWNGRDINHEVFKHADKRWASIFYELPMSQATLWKAQFSQFQREEKVRERVSGYDEEWQSAFEAYYRGLGKLSRVWDILSMRRSHRLLPN